MKGAVKHGISYNGSLGGTRVTMIRTHIGTPATSVIMETLARIKPEIIIRMDYAGSLVKEIPVGSSCVVSGAIAGDGTSLHYLYARDKARDQFTRISTKESHQQATRRQIGEQVDPIMEAYPVDLDGCALPCDGTLHDLAHEQALKIGMDLHDTITWTTDALFLETPEKVNAWRSHGANCVDMETSLIYLLAREHGMKAIALHVISDNLITEKAFYKLDRINPALEPGLERTLSLLEGLVGRLD
ncbi:hypothetical protein GF325_12445 [Candidatus Bathyarchaeota archaeon]|nr:hypothetical protein [Candidatus Bathyarchaeota archaeon]